MKVVVIGTGYVGLVVGACLAETGNTVCCIDVDSNKIAGLRAGRLPIYEPGLEEIVRRNQRDGRLRFASDVAEGTEDAEVVFLAVGTTPGEDGSAVLQFVLDAARSVAAHLRREAVIITKSTVPVGTAVRVAAVISEVASCAFHMASNPEFLKEGDAVEDFLRPDRVVIGVEKATLRAVF